MNPKSWEDSRDDLFPSRQEAVFRELTPVNIKPTNTNDFGLAASRRKERFCHGDVRAGTISGRGRGNDGTRRDALQSLPIPGSSVHSLVKANDSLAAASQSTAANKPLLNQSQMDWLDSGDAIKRHPKRNIETIVSTEDLLPRPFSETSSFGATTISLNTRQSSDIPFKPLLSASKNMTAKKPTQLSFFSPFTSSSSSSSSLSTVGRRSSKPSEVKAALQKSDIPRQHRLQIDLTETKDYEISTYRLYFGLAKTEACLNWKLCLSSSNKLTLKPDNSKMEKRSVGVAYNPLQMHPAIILYTDIEAIR